MRVSLHGATEKPRHKEVIMKEKITVEICCGSYADAMAAWRGGARRIELNSALYMGGLTPSLGSLRLAREHTDLEIIAMVRPRGGGFCYSREEYEQMCADAKLLLENGADGIAFGFLQEEGTVEQKATASFIQLIHSYTHKQAVFHRAFDCVDNLQDAFEILQGLGADRILTSGGAANAWEGRNQIEDLIRQGQNAMQILPGCGINEENAAELIRLTGAMQLHSSCRIWKQDPTGHSGSVSYAYAAEEGMEKAYDCVSEEKVRQLVSSV